MAEPQSLERSKGNPPGGDARAEPCRDQPWLRGVSSSQTSARALPQKGGTLVESVTRCWAALALLPRQASPLPDAEGEKPVLREQTGSRMLPAWRPRLPPWKVFRKGSSRVWENRCDFPSPSHALASTPPAPPSHPQHVTYIAPLPTQSQARLPAQVSDPGFYCRF